jgi:hypothetical protein
LKILIKRNIQPKAAAAPALRRADCQLLGFANCHARLHCGLLLFAARGLILAFAQASSVLYLEIMGAFLARHVAHRAARSGKKKYSA